MAYSPAPAPTPISRRRRRRRNLIVFGVIAVILGAVYGITKSQGERELTRSYLDVAFQVASGESDAAGAFVDIVVNLEDYNRATLLANLEELETSTDQLVTTLGAGEPPSDLVRAHAFLQIAAASWRSGMSDARAGLTVLSSNPLDEDAAAALDRGLVDLRVGDRAYAGFLSEVAGADTSQLEGGFPDTSFVPAEHIDLFDSRELARRMFITPGITPTDDIAVADINLDPAPVGESEGLPVVPVSTEQSVTVTISNRGNLGATGITVSLRLLSNTGDLYEDSQDIAGLEGGAKTSLTFANLPVSPGVTYEVSVSVPGGDDDPDNDSITFRFVVNAGG
jgi:hypothetical protein